MKDKIIFPLIGVVLAILVIFGWNFYKNKPETPVVEADGNINGEYSIESIMLLGKPYICTFEKTDGVSEIAGTIKTDGQKIYGEFTIKTDLLKTGFNSFLLISDKQAYTWTSLSQLGYKSPAAKSASQNASPQEQAQIVGLKDKMPYECKLWQNADNSLFEIPASIKFSEIKT